MLAAETESPSQPQRCNPTRTLSDAPSGPLKFESTEATQYPNSFLEAQSDLVTLALPASDNYRSANVGYTRLRTPFCARASHTPWAHLHTGGESWRSGRTQVSPSLPNAAKATYPPRAHSRLRLTQRGLAKNSPRSTHPSGKPSHRHATTERGSASKSQSPADNDVPKGS